jgi:hypothetical protein
MRCDGLEGEGTGDVQKCTLRMPLTEALADREEKAFTLLSCCSRPKHGQSRTLGR